MQLSLNGKRALVTGASRGIGLAIARAFALAGADVAICARDPGPLALAETTLRATGRKISARVCDVSQSQAVTDWVAQAQADLGGVDILVNNAGIAGPTAAIEDTSLAEWQQTIDVNLTGTFLCTRSAVPLIFVATGLPGR